MQNAYEEVLLQGSVKQVHLVVIYEAVGEALISKAALKTKDGCGPSGFDTEKWRRILVSKSFRSSSLELRKSFANFTRTLCIKSLNTSNNDIGDTLEVFIAHSLIPLNKIPEFDQLVLGKLFVE